MIANRQQERSDRLGQKPVPRLAHGAIKRANAIARRIKAIGTINATGIGTATTIAASDTVTAKGGAAVKIKDTTLPVAKSGLRQLRSMQQALRLPLHHIAGFVGFSLPKAIVQNPGGWRSGLSQAARCTIRHHATPRIFDAHDNQYRAS